MVNLEKNGDSAIRFTFTDSDHYLYKDGYIDVPINSLSLVIDESEMVTFKKSATGDPFISFRADNSNLGTKEAIEQFYKENMVGAGGGISEEEVQDMIDSATSGMPSSQVVEQLRTDVNTISGKVDGNAADIIDIYETIDEKEEVIASALTEVRQDVADIDAKEEVIASALTEVRQNVDTLSGDVQTKVATSDFNAYSAATATALNAKADLSAVTTVSNDLNTLSGAVIDNEYTVSQSLNDLNTRKQNALVSGTNIKTINNESILGSGNIEIQGGATYSAGTNISIDTANTINCTIPLMVTGSTSIKQSSRSSISTPCSSSAVFGEYNNISMSNRYSIFMAGYNNVASNDYEAVFGKFNKSNRSSSTFGNSGNTLFAVGNGAHNAQHNAFEIRQNGDIYVNDGTNDVRLQDTILALGGLKLVKISQADYDALATKDENTLYIIPDADGGGSDWPE